MATYFGYETGAGSTYDKSVSAILIWDDATYVCPGSGNQNIQELSVYSYRDAGAINIRLGVYNGTSLVAEGTGEVAASTTPGWQGHMTQANVKAAGGISPGILIGGTSYHFVIATENENFNTSYAASGTARYYAGDYTGGMIATLPDASSWTATYHMRCGVDPAAGGGVSITATETLSFSETLD